MAETTSAGAGGGRIFEANGNASEAEITKVHDTLVIGGRDMEAGAVSVRLHHGGPQGAKPKAEVVAEILAKIRERRA